MPSSLAEVKRAKLAELREKRAQVDEIERRRLAAVDVFAALEYEPNCKVRHAARQAGVGEDDLPPGCGQCPQELFHSATEFDILFGGSAGGGKSRALTAEAIRACVRYPGIRVGAFRRTYPELEESLLAELAQMQFAIPLGGVWNGTRHELRFPNASLLMFRYAETLQDATRRQGGQYQMLVFDERTLTPPNVIAFLESRLRSGRSDVPVIGIRSSSNPGGAGHGAVKLKYITATEFGKNVVIDDRGRTVRFIPSRLSDNPHVNPEYAADLRGLDEKLRAAFLDGNWDVFAGQMFKLDRDRIVVEPFTLPASWQRFQGIDWGYAAPWAVLWAAVDEDGRVWFYREIHKTQVGEADQAKQILDAEADDEEISVRYADDAMWATRGDAKPIADIYGENGVPLTPAGKGSRVNGWQRVRTYLKDGPACPHHRAAGWDECPMMHIFDTCPEFFRTLADLPHATKGDPEDADSTGEDHLPDAARYLLINLGGGPQFVVFDDVKLSLLEQAGIEVMEPAGSFGRRPSPVDDLFRNEDRQVEGVRGTQRSPFA